MSDYSMYCLGKTNGYALFAKDKGDITNRAKCTWEQTKNTVSGMGKMCITGGVAGILGYGVAKTPKISNGLVKTLNWVTKNIAKPFKDKKIYATFADIYKKIPNKAKALSLIALPALALCMYFSNNMLYKAGQIDQKYTDRANMEDKLKQMMI